MSTLKILLIPSWYPSPESSLVGSFFREQAEFLADRGLDIRVLYITSVYKKYKESFFSKPERNRLTLERSEEKLHTIRGILTVFNTPQTDKRLDALEEAYNEGWQKITNDGWQPDLIHAQSTVNGGIIAERLSSKYKIPFCITEHVPLFFNNRATFLDSAIVQTLERASRVGVVSYHLMRHILMQNVRIKAEVIWNFVDDSRFILKEKERSKFRIVALGYPAFIKDLDTFFNAISCLPAGEKKICEFVVVGNENYSESDTASTKQIEDMAERAGVHGICTFIPFIRRGEMPDFLARADVLVCTSIAETFGVAVREAAMCGVPVISTRNGGVEDLVHDSNGRLANLRDHSAIGKFISEMINGKISFDRNTVRQLAVEQSGRESFFNTMKNFYGNSVPEEGRI